MSGVKGLNDHRPWPAATTSVVAVVGDPIGHSLSPLIHNAAFRHDGLDWVMVALTVASHDGPQLLDAMRTLGLKALAVTTPHKAIVAAGVDRLDPSAQPLRSVNTVLRGGDGSLTGWSTDGDGFVASLQAFGFDPARQPVVVFGAGAAARSIIAALGRCGCSDIAVVNRSRPNGLEELAVGVHVVDDGRIDEYVAGARLIVNATPLGMAGTDTAQLSPVPEHLLGPGQLVADIVYHPLETPLLTQARRAGAETIDGLGMLIHQAALQQLIWTGRRPDIEIMRAAALTALGEHRR